MKLSEITEDADDDDANSFIDSETQRAKIRKIIEYQKSRHPSVVCSSSSSYYKPSSAANCCSLQSSVRKRKSLFELMRNGCASLRRLFAMEHTSLATYFEDYSGSPIIKRIFLCESDAEKGIQDAWAFIKHFRPETDTGMDEEDRFTSKVSFMNEDIGAQNRKLRIGKYKLTRKKSFRRLPRLGLWICRGFRFRLRLRKYLRIVSCKRK